MKKKKNQINLTKIHMKYFFDQFFLKIITIYNRNDLYINIDINPFYIDIFPIFVGSIPTSAKKKSQFLI